MNNTTYPDGSVGPTPKDSFQFKNNDGKIYTWDGILNEWVDEKGLIFKPKPSSLTLPVGNGNFTQPSFFDNFNNEEMLGCDNFNFFSEKAKKEDRTNGCECGVWALRDGGLHSPWCPLSSKKL